MRWLLALALCAGEVGTADGLCSTVCARAAPLRCGSASACVARCQALRVLPACNAPLDRALACFAAVPTSGWECDAEGLPEVKEGHCEREQGAFAACVSARRPRG